MIKDILDEIKRLREQNYEEIRLEYERFPWFQGYADQKLSIYFLILPFLFVYRLFIYLPTVYKKYREREKLKEELQESKFAKLRKFSNLFDIPFDTLKYYERGGLFNIIEDKIKSKKSKYGKKTKKYYPFEETSLILTMKKEGKTIEEINKYFEKDMKSK